MRKKHLVGVAFRRSLALSVAGVLTAVLAACGAGEEEAPSASGGDGAVDQLRVGVLPISTALAFYTAIDKGYFDEVRIEPTVSTLQGGPELFQALEGGSLDVIYSGYTSFFVSVGQGFDFTIVAPNDTENSEEQPDGTHTKGINGILVRSDSGIKSAADLQGKSVAVNALNSFVQLYSMNWLDAEGGDSKATTYVPVPYPGMGDALRGNRVDAVNLSEPFLSIELAKGGVEEIGTPLSVADPHLQVGGWSTRGDFAKGNPDLFARFSEALRRGAEATNAMSNDEKAQILAERLKADPAAYANARWWHYETGSLDVDALQEEADRAVEYGLMPKKIDLADYVFKTATNR
jgi:NitT/TauT family transport system substrate-binding protein